MIKVEVTAILVLALTVSGMHLHQAHNQPTVDLPAGTVALIADDGEFLNICHDCGFGTYTNSAYLSTSQRNWTLEVVGSQVAFKGARQLYLARCNNCWQEGSLYPDSAFVYAAEKGPSSLWTPVLQPNGKYAFRSDNGKYLTRCNGCVNNNSNPNFAFVNGNSDTDNVAQWNVIYTNLPKLGVHTFQADNKLYMRYCAKCEVSNAVSITGGINFSAQWTILRVGTKVAIRGSNGNYLSRCEGCWPGGLYTDSAFVHMSNYDQPFSQWTPSITANGKWLFQSDNGKYLSRCDNCANSTTKSLAFVHDSNPADPWTQWTLS